MLATRLSSPAIVMIDAACVASAPATKFLSESGQAPVEAKLPAPRPVSYAGTAYWDERYARTCNFDWFFTYSAVGELIRRVLGPVRDLPCLHVGCGNSTIQEGMAADGFVDVINIDVSSVVIHQMQAQHGDSPALSYQVCDCRDMSQFPDGTFGGIVDKGTMDAVACAHGGCMDVQRYLQEVDRVLRPGGIFLLVSLASPVARQTAICGPPGSNWVTEVLLLPKPALYLASEASLSGRVLAAQHGVASSKDTPIETLGPFTTEEAMQKLSELHSLGQGRQQHDFFFAYIIKKLDGTQGDADGAAAPTEAHQGTSAVSLAPVPDNAATQPGMPQVGASAQPTPTADH